LGEIRRHRSAFGASVQTDIMANKRKNCRWKRALKINQTSLWKKQSTKHKRDLPKVVFQSVLSWYRAGQIIGRGHNRRVQHGDPTAHGEIDCLRNAGRQVSYRDTVIYSTLMPCAMCAGAVVQFGIAKVIAGENRTFKALLNLCVTTELK
jgi:tRNA(Arg) A34 adenosine deaminase TadA